MAKIDDTLVRKYERRSIIHDMLKRFVKEQYPIDQLPMLEKELLLRSKDTPRLLFDIMMEEQGEVSNLALLLLSEYATPRVIKTAENLLGSEKISEEHKSRIAALLLFKRESVPSLKKKHRSEKVLKKLLYFLDTFWEQLDYLDVGRIWLDDYYDLPVRDKIPLLRTLFDTGSACYLPIYSIELGAPQVTITRFVARHLAEVQHENTLLMLKSFPVLRDTDTRLSMEESVKKLKQERKNGELEPRRPETILPFYKAFLAEEESAGFLSLIFSKLDPDGAIRFLFALIDRWDRGVINCSGDVVEDQDSFHQIVMLLNQQSGLVHHSEIKKDYALWILRKAEKLSLDRGYNLPPEYLLWRNLLWDEHHARRKYSLLFGLNCCECGEPIRTTNGNLNAWLIGDIALCQGCISKKTHCENCGAPINPEQCYALASSRVDHVTVICETCYKKAKRKK